MTVLEDVVGHGRLGFRSALRRFGDLTALPVYEKRVLVDCSPSILVDVWALDSGDTWASPFSEIFDDVLLDVVMVEADGFPPLLRVESLDLCRSTPGTFFFQIFENEQTPLTWDDGITVYDGPTARWDQFSFLFIHLPDGSDPNQTVVSVRVGFFFANRGVVEPNLGRDLILNGGFENGLSEWSTSGTGDASVELEIIDPIVGTASARWILATPVDNFRDLDQARSLEANIIYRLDALYAVANGASMLVIIRGPDGRYIQANGREHWTTEEPSFLAGDTGQNARRLVLDFLTWMDGDYTIRLRGQAPNNPNPIATWDDAVTVYDGGIVQWDIFGLDLPVVLLDEVHLRPIYRFNYHEPRLTTRALPQVQSGSRDVFFATQQLGTGNVGMANGDGYFDSALARFGWEQTEMPIRIGGAFADTGREELLKDDYRLQFKGIARRDSSNDSDTSFSLEDVRGFVARSIPLRVYDAQVLSGLDPAFAGKVRPVWFGPVNNITPAKIGLTGLLNGIYELADPDFLPNGITSVVRVLSYTTSDAAQNQDAALRIQLVEGADYSVSLVLAQITILRDVQAIAIDTTNNFLDWNEGAGALSAQVASGLYTPSQLATAIQLALNSAGALNKAAVYDESTHLFTLSRAAGAFNLLTQTGVNKATSVWKTIGFNVNADKTGAGSYLGDEAIFVSPEKDHFLRVDGNGSRDTTPDGRFTGISGDPIQLGADIARVLWEVFLGQDGSLIDEASFVDARTSAPMVLGIYLNAVESIVPIFQKLQNSNRANIVIDGDGRIRYIVNVPGAVPAGTPSILDVDILNFQMTKEIDDVHGTIRVLFDRNPSTNTFSTATTADPETAVRYRRPSAREFTTYLTTLADAVEVAAALLSISSEPPRRADITVKGLVELVEGEKVIIDRLRGIDPSGSLTDSLFRVLSVRKSPQEARTEIVAVEDV
ncbi:MAG: hypothetical protein ACREJ6_03325 [Candidatus Methylomirabilis sp.]